MNIYPKGLGVCSRCCVGSCTQASISAHHRATGPAYSPHLSSTNCSSFKPCYPDCLISFSCTGKLTHRASSGTLSKYTFSFPVIKKRNFKEPYQPTEVFFETLCIQFTHAFYSLLALNSTSYIQIHEIQPNNELHSSNSLHLGFEPTVSFKITETQLQAKKSHQLVSTRV